MERAGSRWTEEDDSILKKHIDNENYDYEEISIELKRSLNGIRARVIDKFIHPKYKEGSTITELSKIYKIYPDEISRKINRIEDNYISVPDITGNSTSIIRKLIDKDTKEDKLDKIIEFLEKIDDKLGKMVNNI
jgi:uncharacterized membrane-anchored protein YjiN (DUF445 family)